MLGPAAGRRRAAALATSLLAISSVLSVVGVWAPPSAVAATTDAPARELRSIYTSEWGAPRPDGVAILPGGGSTLVVGDDQRLVEVSPAEELVGTLEVPAGVDVRDIGIDPLSGRFVIEDADELVWGRISSTTSTQSDTLVDLGLSQPAGLTFDPAGNLLALDAASETIVNLGRPTTSLDTTPTEMRLPSGVGYATEGLAYNPADGLVYVTNVARDKLYGIDAQGVVQATHDLSGVGILNLTGMSFGPSADPTDAPATTSLYVADAGDATSLGRVAEVSLAAEQAVAAPSVTAQLIRQTNTSGWTPGSPDPAGVTYFSRSGQNRLIVADSEVDETTGAGYHGVNLWETTLAGAVQNTGTTVTTGFTDEPTGLGFDPGTGTLFVSTDSGNRIHMVRPGGDTRYGTGDDVRSSFGTAQYGLTDTEDPAFDPSSGHLFFIDGISREVYDLNPVNGVIGDSGDVVTHFDVGQYGTTDVEGLAYNPSTNTLYVGDRSNGTIYEVTKAGALVRTIDVKGIAALNHISGLGVGPSSDNASLRSIYIVDRAVDNGSQASENDGKLFEIRAPGSGAATNTAPVVNAGPDQTITLPSSANLQGSVTDDGLPNPPGQTTAQWSKVSGPGTVTFANATSPTTTATFSTSGTYVLRLRGDDSALQTTDDVTITVQPAPPQNQPPTVNAGPDQTITLPSNANLQGSATDDGLPNPPGQLTTTWSKVSGPGTVIFGNASSPTTTASFSAAGTYVLRLTANDGAATRTDDVTIYVIGQSSGTLDVPVAAGSDDAEEAPAGSVNLTSPNLQLVNDGGSLQTVGLRFAGLALPRDATITNAYVQFRTDAATSTATSLTIRGQAADDAATFTTATQNVSSRTRTTASVGWTPVAWSTVNEAGTAQRTPNLAPVIEEIIHRTNWAPGQALALIVTGTGKRVADSLEGGFAPVLHVEYSRGPVNLPPIVNAGPDQTITLPNTASLQGSVSDDGLPNPPGSTTKQWTKVSGPGAVTFADATNPTTTATFSAAGTYVLRLTANDGAAQSFDEVTITVNAEPVNQAPVVNAGPDQAIVLPASATLSGDVSDDGLPNPPGSTTKQWSKTSGPGTVIFGDQNSPTTSASFSVDGTYVLRLTANDGALERFDEITVRVLPEGSILATADVPIAVGADDAEESSAGAINLTGRNLRLVTVGGTAQTVGLRFRSLTIPRGAAVTNAYVQFRTDAATSTATSLTIRAQAADDADPFTTATQNVSSRPRTTASVTWVPPAWNTVGEAGTAQRTPNLASLIQEVVDRAGWDRNHAVALIVTGTGKRVADSFEGGGAPVLHLEYYEVPTNVPPTVSAGPDQTITLPADANLQGSVSDDGRPNPPGSTTKQWTRVSGPGTVAFGDASSPTTTASFSEAGTYVLRLTANDGALAASDDVTIVVNEAPTVDAGPDQTITLPADANLQGSVSDDGRPNPPGSTSTQWSKVSGPGTVTFGDAASVATTATFGTDGTYVLALTADDGAAQRTDEVTITVDPAPPPNAPPVTDAGADSQVMYPGPATLAGSVTDDGLPNPPGQTTQQWSKVSGPGNVVFADASSASTSATFTLAGTYVLRLTGNDSEKQSSDDVTVEVLLSVGNSAPTVDAGADQSITLPSDASLDATVQDDGQPSPPGQTTVEWSKASGPGTVTFADRNAVDTTASFGTSGTYVLRLTANDSEASASDTVTIDVNAPPSVSAGADQAISLPSSASLLGTVSDDGLPNPPAQTTVQWSKVSGPGTVTFGSASSASTTASFSVDGTYVLRLTADDSAAQPYDDVTITVSPAPTGGSFDVEIASGTDDAEESNTGVMKLTGPNLKLVEVSGGLAQTVGLRFTGLAIPSGATITSAWVQFQADQTTSGPMSLVIRGQASDDAATFISATNDISSRPRTTASVPWAPASWVAPNAGPAQRTPDLSLVLQEIVDRSGWAQGNDLVLIITGTGRRVAESFESTDGAAPLLHVAYTTS